MPSPDQLLLNAKKSRVVESATEKVVEAIAQTAGRPDNNMSAPAVREASPQLQAAIERAITPTLQTLTNTEAHFWQKRSFWGAFGSAFSGFAAVGGGIIAYMTGHLAADGQSTATVMGIGFAAWGSYSSWRAGRASAPLGAKPRYPMLN